MPRELGEGNEGPDNFPQEYEGDLGVDQETGGPITDDPQATDETGGEPGRDEADAPSETIRDFETDEGATGDETGPPPGIKWGDTEYASPEELIAAADQKLKSFEGRIRAANQQYENEKQVNNRWEDWYAHEQSKASGNVPEAKPEKESAEDKKDAFFKSINWNQLNGILENEGTHRGMQYLAMKMQDHLNDMASGYEARVQEATAPVQEMELQQHAQAYAGQLWKAQVQLVDPSTGDFAYPELRQGEPTYNEKAAQAITAYWGDLYRQYPQFAMTADGVHTAVTAYRAGMLATKPEGGAQATGPAAETPGDAAKTQAAKVAAGKVGRDASGRFVKQQSAQNDASADMGGGSPSLHDAEKPGPARSMSEAAQKKRIRSAGKMRNPFLAVEE
jgi:hypothetical protein